MGGGICIVSCEGLQNASECDPNWIYLFHTYKYAHKFRLVHCFDRTVYIRGFSQGQAAFNLYPGDFESVLKALEK